MAAVLETTINTLK